MFNGRNILILGVLFLLTATINSCKEKQRLSKIFNAFKSTVNKDTLQNQVW